MKKIGILFGKERTFPKAFVERVNSKHVEGVSAEFVKVEELMVNRPSGYAVIIDRISQDVPFYRAFLKNAAATGTAVINNPFWWSADDKFINNVIAEKVGVPVPRTVLLPSKDHPDDTSSESFTNLKFPMEWDAMLDYLGGFPAFMKPYAGGGWKNVYKVENWAEVFKAYHETGQLVMMFQKAVNFEQYYRCYCVGRKHVHIMDYEPRNPHHLRYVADHQASNDLLAKIEDYTLRLCNALGYDLNTVEFGVEDGIPYAIDFCNPAPDADVNSVGKENFEWIVETMSNYAIERALTHKDGQDNLTWGDFIRNSVTAQSGDNGNTAKKPAAKKKA